MPLAGTFDVLNFADVLGLLARQASTGRLHVRTESMQASVWLADGRAVVAEVANGGAADVKAKGRRLLEDICFDALKSPRGSFEFQAQDEVEHLSEDRIDLPSVVEAAQTRLEQWREVESVIQSFDAVPRLAPNLAEEITLDPERWKIFVAIDGRRNVLSLSRRLDIEILTFCALLKPLIEQGAVEMDHPKGRMKSLPKVRLDRPGTGEDIPVFGADDLARSDGADDHNGETARPVRSEGSDALPASGDHGVLQPSTPPPPTGRPDGPGLSPAPEADAQDGPDDTHRGPWSRRRLRSRHLAGPTAGAANGV
jgi:Domain of unknown function (DUF4388)